MKTFQYPLNTFNTLKDNGFYLKMIDQVKKFIFKTIWNTVFVITRVAAVYSISRP